MYVKKALITSEIPKYVMFQSEFILVFSFVENFNELSFPLIFTDNNKANPRFFARTALGGDLRLDFTTLREICNNTKLHDNQWIQNGLGVEYNPCPSMLMEEYTCPIDGCDMDKCAIHWTLCN